MMRTHLLAITACMLLAARALGQSPPAPDPFAGDARLATKRTIAVAGAPLPSLLADLTKQTGIRFVADATIADDKATVYAHDRPLAGTLAALARFFRFAWKREGAAPAWSYRLYQPAAGRAAEEAERDARLLRVADEVLRELRAARELAPLPEAERSQRAHDAETRLVSETDLARRADLLATLAVGRGNLGAALAAADFLKGDDRTAIVRRLRGGSQSWTWPDGSRDRALTEEVAREVRGLLLRSLDADTARRLNRARITVAGRLAPAPSLTLEIAAEEWIVGRRSVLSSSITLPLVPEGRLGGDTAPPDWRRRAAFAAPVTFSTAPRPLQQALQPDAAPVGPLAQALDALERAHPLDLIADSFYSDEPQALSVENTWLGEALSRLANRYGHCWWLDDGFVLLRSRDYAVRRAAEPDARTLALWLRLADPAAPIADAYLAADALLDSDTGFALGFVQRDGISTLGYGERGDGDAYTALWRALAPAQRLQAVEVGLPYLDLRPDERRLYAAALQSSGFSPPASMYGDREDALKDSTLRVTVTKAVGRRFGRRGMVALRPMRDHGFPGGSVVVGVQFETSVQGTVMGTHTARYAVQLPSADDETP